MGSLRDPGTAAMEAEELARATEAARQTTRQARARRARNVALRGDPVARKDLARDFAAVNVKERALAGPAGSSPAELMSAFVGDGPPPEDIPGSVPGDNYLDTASGDLYTLED